MRSPRTALTTGAQRPLVAMAGQPVRATPAHDPSFASHPPCHPPAPAHPKPTPSAASASSPPPERCCCGEQGPKACAVWAPPGNMAGLHTESSPAESPCMRHLLDSVHPLPHFAECDSAELLDTLLHRRLQGIQVPPHCCHIRGSLRTQAGWLVRTTCRPWTCLTSQAEPSSGQRVIVK